MTSWWQGHYCDGRCAAVTDVQLEITASGLQIISGQHVLCWPWEEIQQTQGWYEGEHIRLERRARPPAGGGDSPFAEAVVVKNPAFLVALHEVAGPAVNHLHRLRTRAVRRRLLPIAMGCALLLVGISYWWGLPLLSRLAAYRVPPEWERSLGEQIASATTQGLPVCKAPQLLQVIDDMTQRLSRATDQQDYRFRIHIVRSPQVNAAALPGGHVIIFSGLLAQSTRAEQVAAVLAHEIQHVVHRHGTQAILHNVASAVLLQMLLGDASQAMSVVMQGAQTLGTLQYNRWQEAEADADAFRLLQQADIDPQAMAEFFMIMQRMERQEQREALLPYFSTHPMTQARIDTLRTMHWHAKTHQPIHLPAGVSWATLARQCD